MPVSIGYLVVGPASQSPLCGDWCEYDIIGCVIRPIYYNNIMLCAFT